MLVNNFEQKFTSEFQKVLKDTPISFEPSCNWYKNALQALSFGSLLSLGVSGTEFTEILHALGERKLSCYHFAILSNNLESRSARDLNLVLEDYARDITEACDYSTKWNEQTTPLREELLQVLLAEEAQKNQGEGRNGKLKPIKN